MSFSYASNLGIGSLTRSGAFGDSRSELTPEELAEQRGQWLHQLFTENPQLASLRERLLPWTGGHSFANVVRSDPAAVLAHLNRHTVLELVFQHMHSIGMHLTAGMIERECGHHFQRMDQPWDKTDLALLVSLGVLPLEDPWTISDDPHHHYIEEYLEEDFFASPYREDPSFLWDELLQPTLRVEYLPDLPPSLATIKLASLRRLVAVLVDSNPDDDAIHRFFLVIHTVTSSRHFLEHLTTIFNCHRLCPDDLTTNAALLGNQEKWQKCIINLLKKWTYFHGLFIGRKAIKAVAEFLRTILENAQLCERYEKFVWPIFEAIPKLKYGTKAGRLPDPPVQPDIPNPQVLFRPNLKLTDSSPEEVARQITMIFHTAFKAVHSREFLVLRGSEGESHQTPTLEEFFGFGEQLTRLDLDPLITATEYCS
jgi:hypothetical protein